MSDLLLLLLLLTEIMNEEEDRTACCDSHTASPSILPSSILNADERRVAHSARQSQRHLAVWLACDNTKRFPRSIHAVCEIVVPDAGKTLPESKRLLHLSTMTIVVSTAGRATEGEETRALADSICPTSSLRDFSVTQGHNFSETDETTVPG